MADETGFLAAIRATPGDRTARLAYADWLDERGDPRAELVRVCEGMRDVPVWSDRYWELKARRNVLRPVCSAEWLAATGYDGSWYDPIFRDSMPDDWKARWRLIREFHERWHRSPLGDVGGRQSEIREAEERFGRRLPASVQEMVAFAHDTSRPGEPISVVRDWLSLTPVPGHPATSLIEQIEGGVHTAVRNEDWDEIDPPICEYELNYDREEWTLAASPGGIRPTVTEYVLLCSEGYIHSMDGFGGSVRDPVRVRDELAREFPFHIRVGETELFEGDAMLVRLYPYQTRYGLEGVMLPSRPRESTPRFLWDFAPAWWKVEEWGR